MDSSRTQDVSERCAELAFADARRPRGDFPRTALVAQHAGAEIIDELAEQRFRPDDGQAGARADSIRLSPARLVFDLEKSLHLGAGIQLVTQARHCAELSKHLQSPQRGRGDTQFREQLFFPVSEFLRKRRCRGCGRRRRGAFGKITSFCCRCQLYVQAGHEGPVKIRVGPEFLNEHVEMALEVAPQDLLLRMRASFLLDRRMIDFVARIDRQLERRFGFRPGEPSATD